MRPSSIILGVCAAVLVVGCTSLGHESRAVPQVTKSVHITSPVILDGDDGALSLAIEGALERSGIQTIIPTSVVVTKTADDKRYTYSESAARFKVEVRSTDLDTCVPEGSRQMHFRITVYDLEQRQRVYLSQGRFGCSDSLILLKLSTILSKY